MGEATSGEEAISLAAMRAGARGYLVKGAEGEETLRAIRAEAIIRTREAGLGKG